MSARAALPPEFALRPFAVREAIAAGVSADRLRGHHLAAGITGARIPAELGGSVAVRARAAIAAMPTAVVSHTTAAALWGLPLPRRLQEAELLHVTHAATPRTSAVHRRGVVGHLAVLSEADVTVRGGVRVTTPARVFLDLASELTVDQLVAVGDAMVCWHADPRGFEPDDPLVSLVDLQRRVAIVRRRRGVRTARAALERVRVGADSEPETRLRLMLVDAGLPEPELNVWIAVNGRRRVVLPDLAYRQQLLSVQYDGAHHADPRQHALDIERADLTAAAGWTEVRIAAADLSALVVVPGLGIVPRAVAKVAAALGAQGWAPR
ncbi:hypothetical protein BKD30_11660 [Tersicoccus phoenicis]|uniref:DUF559 domain-containing protein n=1 Tax=Tersicoccus phoenicis TaxID=554083 RepID=A0A1R1L895_9MICC|nr:hypothetical protein [Tersicoccus phoenicis]OMH23679.1 hypothetical protein BKD30_11660 [Tersicoccus phoenicis]